MASPAPPFLTRAIMIAGSPSALDAFVAQVADADAPTVARLIAPSSLSFAVERTLTIDGSVVDTGSLTRRLRTATEAERSPLLTLSEAVEIPDGVTALAMAQLYATLTQLPPSEAVLFLDSVGAIPSPGVDEVLRHVGSTTPDLAPPHTDAPASGSGLALWLVCGAAAIVTILVIVVAAFQGNDLPSATTSDNSIATPTADDTVSATETPATTLMQSTTETPNATPKYEVEGNARVTAGPNICAVLSGTLWCDISGRRIPSDLEACSGSESQSGSAATGVILKWTDDGATCTSGPGDLPSPGETVDLDDGDSVLLLVGTRTVLCSRDTDNLTCHAAAGGLTDFEIDRDQVRLARP